MSEKLATFAKTFLDFRPAVAVTVSDKESGEGLTAVMTTDEFEQVVANHLQRSRYIDLDDSTIRVDFTPPDSCLLSITLRPEAVRVVVKLSPQGLAQLQHSLDPPPSMADWSSLADKSPDDEANG